jgi:hypothetical protein
MKVLNPPGINSHYTTEYMWINFKTHPETMPKIRTGHTDQVMDVGEQLPLDHTIFDDDDASRMVFQGLTWSPELNGLDAEHDPQVRCRMLFWPPNKKTFTCASGVFSTQMDDITGEKIPVDADVSPMDRLMMEMMKMNFGTEQLMSEQ